MSHLCSIEFRDACHYLGLLWAITLPTALAGGQAPQFLPERACAIASDGCAATGDIALTLRAMGAAIFSDSTLSADGRVACASCHRPDGAFADARTVAVGAYDRTGTRNVPSLLDVAARHAYFWDGRSVALIDAVLRPFVNAREHGLRTQEELVVRVRTNPIYTQALRRRFGISPAQIEARHIGEALAEYLNTVRSADSTFDRYLLPGNDAVLSAQARRGLDVFRGRAQCAGCHRLEGDRPAQSDDAYHSVGVGQTAIREHLSTLILRVAGMSPGQVEQAASREPDVAALGRYLVSGDPRDIGRFKTPSLRDVARTAPYMHDGSVATLEAALEQELYYRSLANGQPIELSQEERDDLIAFLHSLTGEP